MNYSTPVGGLTTVAARLFGRSTVTCTCGFTRTMPTQDADSLANNHAGSCRRTTRNPSRRNATGSIGNPR
ncbi:hypothetical protein ACF06T_30610 [Streptomyces albidoflavus]